MQYTITTNKIKINLQLLQCGYRGGVFYAANCVTESSISGCLFVEFLLCLYVHVYCKTTRGGCRYRVILPASRTGWLVDCAISTDLVVLLLSFNLFRSLAVYVKSKRIHLFPGTLLFTQLNSRCGDTTIIPYDVMMVPVAMRVVNFADLSSLKTAPESFMSIEPKIPSNHFIFTPVFLFNWCYAIWAVFPLCFRKSLFLMIYKISKLFVDWCIGANCHHNYSTGVLIWETLLTINYGFPTKMSSLSYNKSPNLVPLAVRI